MIPAQYQAPCDECGRVLDVRKHGTFQRVHGWSEQRRQGGANTIALAERERRWLCGVCVDLRRRKIAPSQERLL